MSGFLSQRFEFCIGFDIGCTGLPLPYTARQWDNGSRDLDVTPIPLQLSGGRLIEAVVRILKTRAPVGYLP